MTKPLVSIYSCTYNSSKHIKDTIESIVAQTYLNKEFVIVDDCSTDSTPEILKDYAQRYSWIKIILLEENLHCVNASNVAYHNIQGKYFAGCAHDDMWLPDKLEKQVAFMEAHPEYGVCFTKCSVINEYGNATSGKVYLEDLFNQPNRTQKEWANRLLVENQFCAASALIRTECMGENEFYQYGLLQLQDYELWLRLIKDYEFYILQEQLTKYRWFENEKTNLSFPSSKTSNRTMHEFEYIVCKYIKSLSDEQMIRFYRERFRNMESHTHEEILCEKAFLMLSLKMCHSIDFFIELLDEKSIREVLKKSFGYSLQDFYKDNLNSFRYDNEMYMYAMGLEDELSKLVANEVQRLEKQALTPVKQYAVLRTLDSTLGFEQFILDLFPRLLFSVAHSLVPVIDTKYYPLSLWGTKSDNPFYDYFENIGKKIDEIYCLDSSTVEIMEPIEISCEKYNDYLIDLLNPDWINEDNVALLGTVYNEYLAPSELILGKLGKESIWNDVMNKKILGVRLTQNNPTENIDEYINQIEEWRKSWDCECIYISSDSEEQKNVFKEKYIGEYILLDGKLNATEHLIADVEVLANCDSIVGTLDVITMMAILRNMNKFNYVDLY